jgi:hypothetical protein
MTGRAIKLLDSTHNDAYEAAWAALSEDTQAWWADLLARGPDELDEGEEPASLKRIGVHVGVRSQ